MRQLTMAIFGYTTMWSNSILPDVEIQFMDTRTRDISSITIKSTFNIKLLEALKHLELGK
jgi:hypothetical protein